MSKWEPGEDGGWARDLSCGLALDVLKNENQTSAEDAVEWSLSADGDVIQQDFEPYVQSAKAAAEQAAIMLLKADLADLEDKR